MACGPSLPLVRLRTWNPDDLQPTVWNLDGTPSFAGHAVQQERKNRDTTQQHHILTVRNNQRRARAKWPLHWRNSCWQNLCTDQHQSSKGTVSGTASAESPMGTTHRRASLRNWDAVDLRGLTQPGSDKKEEETNHHPTDPQHDGHGFGLGCSARPRHQTVGICRRRFATVWNWQSTRLWCPRCTVMAQRDVVLLKKEVGGRWSDETRSFLCQLAGPKHGMNRPSSWAGKSKLGS